jgi:hypothetical protein
MKTLSLALLILSVSIQMKAEEPKDLLALRQSFERARTAAVSPLEKKYEDALLVLKDRLTRGGDFDGAVAVQAELQVLRPATVPEMPGGKPRLARFENVEEFAEWVKTTKWESADGSIVTFPGAKTVEVAKPNGETFQIHTKIEEPGVITYAYSNGVAERIEMASDLESATRKSAAPLKRIELK